MAGGEVLDAASGAEIGILAGGLGGAAETRQAISRDSRYIAGSCGVGLSVWNARTQELITTFKREKEGITACAFSPDGQRVIAATAGEEQWNEMKVWNVASGSVIAILRGHKDWIRGCAYSPDGRSIVTASDDMTVKIWDAAATGVFAASPGHNYRVNSCACSPDGRRFIAASSDWTLKLWDTDAGTEIATFGEDDRRDVTACVDLGLSHGCAYSPDGRGIFSTSWFMPATVWAAADGAEIARSETGRRIKSFQDTPDGRHIVIVPLVEALSMNDSLRVLRSDTLEEVAAFYPCHALSCFAMAKSGQVFVAGDKSGQVYLLNFIARDVGLSLVTAVHLFRARSGWDTQPSALCEGCGRRFFAPPSVLDVIRGICRDSRLSPGDSPCEKLPSAAWDEPRLNSECPSCHCPVRFNPFLVDNRDLY